MQEIETTTPAVRGQSAQMVWDAILELHNSEKRIKRGDAWKDYTNPFGGLM